MIKGEEKVASSYGGSFVILRIYDKCNECKYRDGCNGWVIFGRWRHRTGRYNRSGYCRTDGWRGKYRRYSIRKCRKSECWRNTGFSGYYRCWRKYGEHHRETDRDCTSAKKCSYAIFRFFTRSGTGEYFLIEFLQWSLSSSYQKRFRSDVYNFF